MTSKPTLFIVDDDDAFLDSMATMAETVGMPAETFPSARAFLDRYEPDRPGCLVLDVRMPDISGLELQEILHHRGIELPVIVISGHAEVPLVVRALKSGAVDFLEKPFHEQDMLDRIRTALEVDLERRAEQTARRLYAERFATLTPREREVLLLLVVGHAGKQVAADLGISYKTMEKFRGNVMRKMHADSIVELVLMAVSLGLASPRDVPKDSPKPAE